MGRTAEEAKNYLAEVILALFEHLAGSMSLRTVRVRVEKGALVALEPINLPDDMECELTLFEKPDEEGRYHGALRVLSYPPRGH